MDSMWEPIKCHMTNIDFVQKNFESASAFFMYTYGFELHHMTAQTLCLYGFTVMS